MNTNSNIINHLSDQSFISFASEQSKINRDIENSDTHGLTRKRFDATSTKLRVHKYTNTYNAKHKKCIRKEEIPL